VPASPASPLRLPLVLPGHELSGKHPQELEKVARRCAVGDAAHHALLYTAETIVNRGLGECIAPSVRGEVQALLAVGREWTRSGASLAEVRRARACAFNFSERAEQATLQAIAAAVQIDEQDALDRQAAITVRRYVARAVQHSLAGVLMVLDAVTSPPELLPIAADVAGAIAFKRVGLGAARSPELRAAAAAQAQWESERLSLKEQPAVAIALQLFHEYLGAQWKDHADAQRVCFEEFSVWALRR
jgi:hypothetical protein